MSVLYRENCGGTLRHLASGFRDTIANLADVDLYDDLRERIFSEKESCQEEQARKKKMCA